MLTTEEREIAKKGDPSIVDGGQLWWGLNERR